MSVPCVVVDLYCLVVLCLNQQMHSRESVLTGLQIVTGFFGGGVVTLVRNVWLLNYSVISSSRDSSAGQCSNSEW